MARNMARNDIDRRLQQAIDGLRKDCLRIEIWAAALSSFSQPVPDYDPARDHLLKRKNDNDER